MHAYRIMVTTDITIAPDIATPFPTPGTTVTAMKNCGSFMSLLHSVDKKGTQAIREANPTLADIAHAEVSVVCSLSPSAHWLNPLSV